MTSIGNDTERRKIVMIGAGNLATNLGKALVANGYEILQVYSKTMRSASALATNVNAIPTDNIEKINTEADVYIVSIKDNAMPDIIPTLCKNKEEKVNRFEEENQETVCNLLKRIKKTYPAKSVWCYTGYVLEQDILPKDGRKHTKFTDEILSCIDVLVDGPFIESKRNLMLEYRGSENQRLIDLPSTLKEKRIIPYIVKQTSMD